MARILTPKPIAARRRVTRAGGFPLWPVLAALACLGALWWGVTEVGSASDGRASAGPTPPVSPNVPVPIAGTRTLSTPLTVCVAIDESSSTERTDLGGLRHDESEAIADWMARYSGNREDRFCAVRFASSADGVGPVPVAGARTALADLFTTGTWSLGGSTDLDPAVDEIITRTAPYAADRRVAILITDGQVDNGQRLDDLVGAVDSVYIIGLDGDGFWSAQTHRVYENRGLTQVLTLGSVQHDALAKTLAGIILRETGQQVAGPRQTQRP